MTYNLVHGSKKNLEDIRSSVSASTIKYVILGMDGGILQDVSKSPIPVDTIGLSDIFLIGFGDQSGTINAGYYSRSYTYAFCEMFKKASVFKACGSFGCRYDSFSYFASKFFKFAIGLEFGFG